MIKKNNSIEVWSNAFIIYMSIYIVKHPIETQDMLKYMNFLRLGASRNPSSNWKDYDIQLSLSLCKARNMSLGWGAIDPELWMMYMCQSQSSSLTVPPQQMIQKCYDFNYRGSCTKQGCRYSHTCIKCNKISMLVSEWITTTTLFQPKDALPKISREFLPTVPLRYPPWPIWRP